MNRWPMCLPNKRREKGKSKRKRKEKEEILQHFALKPEHGPRGIWLKPLKPGAVKQVVGSTDLVLATRVDRWSLASCRCWILEIIRSPG